MGISQRFKDIMKSNISGFLSKGEPEEKVREHITGLALQLAEIRKEMAQVLANQTKLKRRLDEKTAECERFDGLAKKAAGAGNSGDARVFLEKKQECETERQKLSEEYEEISSTAEKMKQLHDKLVREINQLNDRLNGIKAREYAADAQQAVNKAESSAQIDEELEKLMRQAEEEQAMADAEKYKNE